ncbi:Methylamine utilization protein [Salinisphaera shabanensis E1L3A]|uniref:Methylamine utilization protein n=1 Tax=Salinisphaera shabanensis E1L3A TaxID=1033802 RepID=U2EB76_9GAMM|nr:cytochrome c peroxidase [Salinisphaera shabanensis]ERJ20901.1 Methylamine utilization protein [Salinisphaera shabanensis E1L3A]
MRRRIGAWRTRREWLVVALVAAATATFIGLVWLMAPAIERARLVERYRGPQADWPRLQTLAGRDIEPLAALPEQPDFPANNPFSEAKAALGKRLFFDPRLSASNQIACASCHDPSLGWADGRHKAETQIIASWSNPIEMAGTPTQSARQLAGVAGYAPLFEAAYDDPRVTVDRMTRAIATFMRTLNTPNTRFDRFMRGARDTFTAAEIRGLDLFRGKANCIRCHNGALLTDGDFHHLGTSVHGVGNYLGRYGETGAPADVGTFQTPGLRNIGRTAPYMHNGFGEGIDLKSLLALYNMGWWQNAPPGEKTRDIPLAQLSPLIEPLGLSADEINDLAAFLGTLDGASLYMAQPELP